MKFTTVATDAFQKFQLNAGILLTDFDPTDPVVDRSTIFAATSGGASFTVSPEFVDFGEDVDNVPANTMELKVLQSVTATMSGTLKTVDTSVTKRLMAAADIGPNGKLTPRADLVSGDFFDLWWVGDYSNVNTGDGAGFMAIKLVNALSTGGFSLQPNDKGKGDFAFEFTGHYTIDDMSVLPYEIYIQAGNEDAGEEPDTTLAALSITGVTLSPTFSATTTTYTASTTATSNVINATATDATNATVVIRNGSTTVTSGNAATWETGSNTVTVTVTNGTESLTYTITVTKA